MVCVQEESHSALCIVRHVTDGNDVKTEVILPATSCVSELFQLVGKQLNYHQDSFDLILQTNREDGDITLTERKNQTVEMAGLSLEPGNRNKLVLFRKAGSSQLQYTTPVEDELRLGASASPTASGDDTSTPRGFYPATQQAQESITYSSYSGHVSKHDTGCVGLVNQAMTCYLNSLLQALFMTPEFRNAMYIWEYDNLSDECKSIPYQLQKLFLNLQTSNRSAVETTELTRSFGWDSSEAWQQHDIQELCRVMFDALEQKFKNTKQADLINRLYEGKMIDYVKCLECSTEKSREDKFLDIPLPVRPFGSSVAYGSVEEALRAFVQPETLDGNNQYFCETCNKKCDAHKGLKFSKFPYLLTLHLKRFDFDYNTLHRIKLNDKVSFPERLNLNSFITQDGKIEENCGEVLPEETVVKYDDSSTTDSGSALDDEVCQTMDTAAGSSSSGTTDFHTNEEDDEGIDVSHQNENEKNRQNLGEKGPYIYELFSIMIHSGSATGGHYYAYIKDFKDGCWYCFNDQSVTRITDEDIKKTFGGGPVRGYYSGAYSSSTNAYMLMYRQIDKERNSNAMTVDEFPPHINTLLKKMQEHSEFEARKREREMEMLKAKLYCYHPTQSQLVEIRLYLCNDLTLKEATVEAYKKLNLENVVPIERCRLVSYDRLQDMIESSYDGKEDDQIGELFNDYKLDLLMDIRAEDEEFEVYKPGSINTKVLLVNVETEEIEGPIIVRANLSQTVKEYKETLAKQLKLDFDTINVVLEKYSNDYKLLQADEKTLKNENFYGSHKCYVSTYIDADPQTPFIISKLHKIIDRFEHVITLSVTLPDVSKEILEKLNIPPLELSTSPAPPISCNLTTNDSSRGPSPNGREPSPQLSGDIEDESLGPTGPSSDQSASEDSNSSLTDSERTIVGDAPGDCLAQLSPCGSPVQPSFDTIKVEISKLHTENWDDQEEHDVTTDRVPHNYYFKATSYNEKNTNQRMLKVLVDKRMILHTLKTNLEPYVGVPADHFKVYRLYNGTTETECSRLTESLNIYRDEEKLTVKLGRALRKGEYLGNVYLLTPDDPEPIKHLFEWIIAKGANVGQVKQEILEEMKTKLNIDIPYNRCRLRKKNWKNPTKCYLDDSQFDELTSSWDIFIQELPGSEIVTNNNQMLLFVRQWVPSTLELKTCQEIVLDSTLVSEVKEKINELSGIPIENIDIARGQGTFPCNTANVVSIHSDLEWNPAVTELSCYPLNIYDDGFVIIYRDNREKIKQLSSDERRVMLNKSSKLNSTSSSSISYSPRKERALKIYLDTTPPRRREESDVD